MTGEKNYITPTGLKKLQYEYDDLRHYIRPKVVEEVSLAAALGDRSENAEYIYGKKRLREIDSRLAYLSKCIDNLYPIDPATIKANHITFGATVTIEYEDGKIVTYHIVGENEVDVSKNKISYKSPVGRALINKKQDDSAIVHRPAGPVEVTILDFKYIAIE